MTEILKRLPAGFPVKFYSIGKYFWWSCIIVLTIALPIPASAADKKVKGVAVKQTRNLTEYDSILGWRKIPNFHATHIQGEYQVEMRYNARSFRGPLYPYARTPDTYRILIMGDSYADGYSVEFDDLFTETMLKQMKMTIKKPIEVVNSAVGGYGTDQQLLYYLIDGQRYKPDLTILLFYANDLTYNIKPYYSDLKRGAKPYFGIQNGRLYLKRLPKPTKDRKDAQRKDFYDAKLVKQTLEMFAKPKAAAGDSAKPSKEKPVPAYGSGRGKAQWEMTEALMKKLSESCDASESHLLLFYVPVKNEIYGHGNKIQHKPSRFSSNLRVLAERLKIDLIDTLPMFQDKAEQIAKKKQRIYWPRDSHWTPRGHHLAGQILARYLTDRCKQYGLCPQ